MSLLLLYSTSNFGINVHAFRYYRVYCTATLAGTDHFMFAEITLAETSGGANTTSGQTVSASSFNSSGEDATKAIDGSNGTHFCSQSGAGLPQWWMIDYGSTAGNWKKINQIAITAIDGGGETDAPRNFLFQGSDDGSTWTTLLTETGQGYTAFGTNTYLVTASGSGTSGINGSLSQSLGALTLSSTATLKISGSVSNTLGTLTSTATGKLLIKGSLSGTLGTLTSSATGKLLIKGSLNKTLGTLTGTETGQLLIKGSLSKTLGVLTLSATGSSGHLGSLNKTLGVLTGSATGKLLIKGSLSRTLGTLTSASSGRLLLKGSVNTTLGSLTSTETGKLLIKGSLNSTLGVLTLTSIGSHPVTNRVGSLVKTLSPMVLNATALAPHLKVVRKRVRINSFNIRRY